eukprot:CAMPEP_0178431336 /NCGR_PEP_ID=MMETSP0689_2-20121128/31793_1 /TAXON_ID=160604 /ORGANISM="Amphidinium massartii, Strain CS-259" /LENGTH=619 /DNA_ID=CAMNT_0020053241 /DNA_START=74 /DNA_END=1931 /DNA_ORIENTATION=-
MLCTRRSSLACLVLRLAAQVLVAVSATEECGSEDAASQALGVSMLQTARITPHEVWQAGAAPEPWAELKEEAEHPSHHKRGPMHWTLFNASRDLAQNESYVSSCLVTRTGCNSFVIEPEPEHKPFEGVQIIVTRYNEDLTWLDALPDFDTVVYNKGNDTDLMPTPRDNLQIKSVANLGREDETMLRHMVMNYHDLPEITVFLQGWPYDHCGQLGTTLRQNIAAAKDSGNASKAFVPISHTYWAFNGEGNSLLTGLAGQLVSVHGIEEDIMREYKLESESELFSAMCSKILQAKCPSLLWIAEGAQWIVGRDWIRSSSIETYQRAISMREGFQDEYRGIVLEALWPVLWGRPDWQPQDSVASLQETETVSPHVAMLLRPAAGSSHCWSELMDWAFPEIRLGSCKKTVGFCELSWRVTKEAPKSNAYLNSMRNMFALSALPTSKEWSMEVTIQAALPGKSSIVEVMPQGTVNLTRGTSGLPTWVEIVAAIGNSSDPSIVLLQSEQGLYLGCDGWNEAEKSKFAVVKPTPTHWRLHLRSRSYVHFQTADGYYLCREAGGYEGASLRKTLVLTCSSSESCEPLHLSEVAGLSRSQFYVIASRSSRESEITLGSEDSLSNSSGR